jgi:hypothetical protein
MQPMVISNQSIQPVINSARPILPSATSVLVKGMVLNQARTQRALRQNHAHNGEDPIRTQDSIIRVGGLVPIMACGLEPPVLVGGAGQSKTIQGLARIVRKSSILVPNAHKTMAPLLIISRRMPIVIKYTPFTVHQGH